MLAGEELEHLLDGARPGARGTSTGIHVRSFGGSASTSSFVRRSMTPCNWTVSSSMFDAPPVFQPYSPFSAAQYPLGEREKAAAERVSGQLQQHEKIAGTAGERRSGQKLHRKAWTAVAAVAVS